MNFILLRSTYLAYIFGYAESIFQLIEYMVFFIYTFEFHNFIFEKRNLN